MLINFSAIPWSSLLGRSLRLPLKAIPQTTTVPILQGPLRGKKWIAFSSVHGCWLGSYELEKQKLFAAKIHPGAVVYDLGANVGFYSLLSAVLVGKQGHVYAFEPLPSNIVLLRRHLELNCISNVSIIVAAVSQHSGKAAFELHASNSMCRISDAGAIQVCTIALDDFVFGQDNLPPDIIKIDVEGAEFDVLRGARCVLRRWRPLIFLATHGMEVHSECRKLLGDMDYESQPIHPNESNEIIAMPY